MPPDRPSSRPVLPAAVSTLVGERLAGPVCDAIVVAAHRYALYLSVRGWVLPVVAADAVALPTALRLAVASGAVSRLGAVGRPWGVGVGDVVAVGGSRVVLPDLDVLAVRTWRPSRVRPHPTPHGECGRGCQGHRFRTRDEVDAVLAGSWSAVDSPPGAGGPGLGSGSGAGSGWLADGIRSALSAVGCSRGRPDNHLSTQLAQLVGRGPGLTPSGDDALAGALLVAHALGTGEALADAVRARLGATTAVSAALLDAAGDGYAARPVVTLVDAAVRADPDAVARALPAVLGIGHTSGADLVTGIRVALAELSPRVGCPDGRLSSHLSTRLDAGAA